MRDVFVPAVGQFDNIGDIVLRRPLLDTLRPLGTLHIYLGDYPDGYRNALRLSPTDVIYRSFGRWYRALVSAALRGTASYAFKPGEIQLTISGMKEHVGMLPGLIVLRLRGGKIVRVGSGARSFARLPRALMRPSIALSQLVAWRDAATTAYLGGETMPDFGFLTNDAPTVGSRQLMVVSMRGDRPAPDAAWIDGIAAVAAARGLELRVVTQVARDSARTRELARAFDAAMLDWNGVDHLGQELALRELYRSARVVVSDRLHVLITAVTEGATPVALLPAAADKIDRHFAAAGYPSVSAVTEGMTAGEVASELERLGFGSGAQTETLAGAQASIAAIQSRVSALLAGSR